MDRTKKKELLMQWKTRHPEMGIISIQCKATGEIFADISKDLQTAFNSHRFQLSAALHSSRRLQELWNEHGEDGFEPNTTAQSLSSGMWRKQENNAFSIVNISFL